MSSAMHFSLAERWIELANLRHRHILLPEGNDRRVIKAARMATDKKLCKVSLIGNRQEIIEIAHRHHIPLSNIDVIEIQGHPLFSTLAEDYSKIRERDAGKPLPYPMAAGMVSNPLFFACLMMSRHLADGVVAGAVTTTANVLRAGRLTIGTADSISEISSCYIMECKNKHLGHHGILGFADCAVITNPSSRQLSDIVTSTVKTMRNLVDNFIPKVAILSFSSHGSAKHESIDRITEAIQIVRQTAPDLIIDGELQVDAALIPEIGSLKAPQSRIQGDANILVFPDLNSANIGYKLVQYTSGALAHGPLLQGFRLPLNDISRGATAEDILRVMAITCLQN